MSEARVIKFNGRLTFVSNDNGFKITGSNRSVGESLDEGYHSFSYSINAIEKGDKVYMFGSPYELEVSKFDENTNDVAYKLVGIDALSLQGYVAFTFRSSYSSNVTNTESRTYSLIVHPSNEIVKFLKYGVDYSIKRDVKVREDSTI